MNLIPKQRSARIRLGILCGLLFVLALLWRPDRLLGYWISDKQEGDVLFQSLPHMDLVDAIETITESEWSHCGVLVRREGRWHVAEAIGEVRYTPLTAWLLRGRRCKVVSYRLPSLTAEAFPTVASEIDKMIGKFYDFSYAPDDREIYCSELVYKAYHRAMGIEIGEWQALGNQHWKPKEAFIRSMEGGKLPLERLMITPVALTRSPLWARVH